MASIPARVNGKEYILACDDGQERHLQSLVSEVDTRAQKLAKHFGGKAPEPVLLLYTALTLADEMTESKKEGEKLKRAVAQGGDDAKFIAFQEDLAVNLQELASRIEAIATQLEQ
jgi:cell division protein ZapA